ncbi:hypothetical protein Tco_0720762 [Tanacetum coccineum]
MVVMTYQKSYSIQHTMIHVLSVEVVFSSPWIITFSRDEDMFGVNDLEGDEVVIETEVASKDVNLSVDEVTLAQALATLKSEKPKANKVVIQEQGTITTTSATITVTAASTRPKAKGLVIHEEEQTTTPTVSSQQPSQVKVQDKAKIDADYQLAQRLQAQEQEELTDEEKARLQDLEDLYKLVKAKYGSTRPVEDLNLILYGEDCWV